MSLNCVNCGGNINATSLTKYIICEYCGSRNSNFLINVKNSINTIENNISSDEFDSLNNEYNFKDYESTIILAKKILDKNQNSWIALTYLAISEFWMGTDDFSHLDRVKKYITKAKIISDNNEIVLDTANQISNNCVILGVKNKYYGEELKSAIYAFNSAVEISTLDETSQKILEEYIKEAYFYQKDILSKLLKKNKKDYEPPLVNINCLYDLFKLHQFEDMGEFLYLHLKILIEKSKSKSYYKELCTKLENIESTLIKMENKIVGKSIKFSIFGMSVS